MDRTYDLQICGTEILDIEKTFECGQCFRWNADENGVYSGIAYGYPAFVKVRDGNVIVRSSAPEELWRDYFDLGRDYKAASHFSAGEYLERCIACGYGIRILRQEPWEALCSFIISQCNNIPRIKSIVERLCKLYGDETELDGRVFYTFPRPERVAALSEQDLAPLKSGYRAAYILNAARMISDGSLKLESLIDCDWHEAKNNLLALFGVGEKVANCVLLFGLYHMEAFPVDTWIRRALKEHFPPDFDPATLGPNAGLAQQYIFYYARSCENKENML